MFLHGFLVQNLSSPFLGFGKSALHTDYTALTLIVIVDGILGINRSTDEAKNWSHINDRQHQEDFYCRYPVIKKNAEEYMLVFTVEEHSMTIRRRIEFQSEIFSFISPRFSN